MLIKLLGCGIIMLCTAKIGFDKAGRFTRRVGEIRELQTALAALKGEIGFARTPMPEALIKTGQRLKTAVAGIFSASGEALRTCDITAGTAWETGIDASKKDLALKEDDIYIIRSFGELLGGGDVAGQLENIDLAMARLSVSEGEAIEDERKHARLYRTLGIIGGIVLAVIFI